MGRRYKTTTGIQKLKNDVSKMKSLFKKPEVKQSMIVHNTTASTAGSIFQIGSISQGVAHDQRIGNEVELLSSSLRYMWSLADTGYNSGRLAIIRTRGPLGSVAEAFENTSFLTFGAVYAAWDYDIVQKVYLDKQTTLNQLVSGQRMTKFSKKYVKHPMELKFDDSVSTSQLDYLYVLVASDSAILPHPGLNLVCRTRFSDV